MSKTSMMMMTHLLSAAHEPDRESTDNRSILLLYFHKAYDTVSRDILTRSCGISGFADSFITMIRNLHHNTTARFIVNGMLSDPIPAFPDFRQGCSLELILFFLVAKILTFALLRSTKIRGLRHPGLPTQEHKFSAFVDDSAVFFTSRGKFRRYWSSASFFIKLFEISVQLAKSEVIFLNTAIAISEFEDGSCK